MSLGICEQRLNFSLELNNLNMEAEESISQNIPPIEIEIVEVSERGRQMSASRFGRARQSRL
jgi:hypothetical protein